MKDSQSSFGKTKHTYIEVHKPSKTMPLVITGKDGKKIKLQAHSLVIKRTSYEEKEND